ncbi:MAG: N-acetylneuraminate synthase family protein [Deltaproteobacteria bacterium]|nr:N-acetylneuraminate synthase family protein [Deltaproteobacteria bacterium]
MSDQKPSLEATPSLKTPLVVAEIGGNHAGDPQKARLLCQAAQKAGAGAIKFQAYQTKRFIHPQNPYYAELAQEELPFKVLKELLAFSRDLGLKTGLTVFGPEGLDLALEAKADYIKISSGDLTYHPLIRLASQLPLPLVISTGASSHREVEAARSICPKSTIILQCAALYPAPLSALNLAVMAEWLRKGLKAGFSDHGLEIEPAIAALRLGAAMVEKHFAIDRDWPGGDNAMSSLPEDFQKLALLAQKPPEPPESEEFFQKIAKDPPIFWGNSQKGPLPGENPSLIRRWAVAAKPLAKGQELKPEDILFQRTPPSPSPLLSPEEPWKPYQLARALAPGQLVSLNDLMPLEADL